VPYFGPMLLTEITGEHVQQFIRKMHEGGYAPHSVHHYHTVLSTVLTTAVKWKKIPENPAFKAVLPVLEPVRPQWVLTYEQARLLLARLSLRPRLAVLLTFVLRRGEAFAARWKHFDPQTGTIQVEEAIYDHVLNSPKTKKSVRSVPLPTESVEMLLAWQKETRYAKPEDFILAGRSGKAGDHARVLRGHIKPACRELGLPPATYLTFRRTWSTWADEKGVSPKMRGELQGNSEEINSRIYTKVIPDSLRVAVQSVGSELFANCAQSPKLVNEAD
jgi:integrase